MIAITDGSIAVIADWHLALVLAMDRASIGALISLLPAHDSTLLEQDISPKEDFSGFSLDLNPGSPGRRRPRCLCTDGQRA